MTQTQIAEVREIVRRVAGIDPQFVDSIPIPKDHPGAKAWGITKDGSTAQGQYLDAADMIHVALDYGSRRAGFHEAFHRLQRLFFNDRELAVLKAEEQKLRDMLRGDIARRDQVDRMAATEVEAEAFAVYANNRRNERETKGLNAIVMRTFGRIYRVVSRLRNLLHGLGYQTSQDIFERAMSGETARRPARTNADSSGSFSEERGADGKPQTVIPGTERISDKERASRAANAPLKPRKGQKDTDGLPLFGDEGKQGSLFSLTPSTVQNAVPKVDIPNEIIADHLEAKNMTTLARISRRLKIGTTNTTEARVKIQDKFLRWKRIQDAVETATGQKLPETFNTYMAESLYYGRTGQRLEELDDKHIDPLVDEVKKQGLSLDEVNRFLMARHAPERNAKIRKINPDIADPSGMSDAEAKSILDKIDTGGKRAAYDAVEKRVRGLIDETRATLRSGGLIGDETLNAWEAAYKNYVPLRGFADDAEVEATHSGTGKGFDVRGEESKRAMGRSSLADSPLAYTFLQAQQAIIRAEKAKVGRTAMRFVNANPMPELWEIKKADTVRTIDKSTGMVTNAPSLFWKEKDNVFAMKIDGEPYFIEFKGEHGADLARALKNLGTGGMHPVMRFIATLTRIQARLATSLNPDFMIPNMVRDLGEAFINMQEQEQKKFVRQFAKHLFPAVGGSFRALIGKEDGKYTQAFREFDEAGGRIRFFGMENAEDIKSNVASKLRRLEGGAINNARAAGEKAMEAIEIANATIENATRVAVFLAGKDVGLTPAKAASLAREMTVNFNRKGEWGSTLTGLYMFANASLQGTTRMVTALRNSKNVRRGAYALAAAGSAMALYNIGAGGDDDDGIPHYLKIPHWTRDLNLIVMWPKGFGRDGQYVKVPLPYGYSFFHVIGARLTGLALGKEKAGKVLPAIAKSVLDAFDPLGKDENMLAQFAPTLVRPAVHIATNQNWTGRPISPEPMPWNKHAPDSTRHFRSASEFSVGAAKKLNALTGGTAREPGLIDWSPGTIDYMIGFVTGGLGRFVKNSYDTAIRGYEGQEWQPEKTPIVRRFVGAVDPAADRALYFEERDKVMAVHQRVQGYAKDRDHENRRRLIAENNPEFRLYEKFQAVDRQRKGVLKGIDELKADSNLTAAVREQKIKEKERQEVGLMNGARRALEQKRRERRSSATAGQDDVQPAP